jgi:hypothetical protein
MMRVKALVAVLALTACGGGSSPRPIERARPGRLATCTETPAPAPPERHFGSASPGFVVWLSRNGRLAVAYEFRTDDDKDGDIQAEFEQHHGVPGGDKPHPWLFDLVAGTERAIDDLMLSDPSGRRAIIRAGKRVLLVDSRDGTSQDLVALGLDVADDENQCLPPRQLAFDPSGRLLVFIQRDGRSIVTWDLETGQRDTTRVARGRLWRAEPLGRRGWLRVDAVVEDVNADGVLSLPVQRTTCACRFCRQFAAMSSTFGWEPTADLSRVLLVRGDGRTVEARTEVLVPLGDRTLLGVETRKVTDVDGHERARPEGCIDPALTAGGTGLLLECKDGSRVWWPDSGRQVALGGYAVPLSEIATVEGNRAWLPIALARDGWGKDRRVGRVDLDSGALELGARIASASLDDDGTALAARARSCDAPREPALPDTCRVEPAEKGEPVGRGPWTLRCAAP